MHHKPITSHTVTVLRTLTAATLLLIVIAGSVTIGAINTIANETWPEI